MLPRSLICLLLVSATGFADTPEATRVMAVLKANCVDCHNATKAKAELGLHTREALLAGSEHGPVVVAGKPAESRLVEVLDPDAEEHMPPKGQLSDEEIALLANWVREGLPWDASAMAEAPPAVVEPRDLPVRYTPGLAVVSTSNRVAWAQGNVVLERPLDGGKAITNAVHRDAVRALAWNASGTRLASASHGRVQVGDSTFEVPGLVSALAWSGEELVAAVGDPGQPSSLLRWPAETNKPVRVSAHGDSVLALVALPRGQFASASVDGTVNIWSNHFQDLVRTLEGHTGYVTALALSPDGKQLATGSADQSIQVWDWQIGFIERTLSGHDTEITGLHWSSAGLFATGLDGRLRRYSGEKTTADRSSDPGPPLHGLAPGKDGTWFAVDARGRLLEHDQQVKRKTPEALPEHRPKLSFLHDVLPVLNRAGCNAGECHARQGGQGGFHLTVFSYDPAADFQQIVHAAGGRRVFPAAPEHSLLLRKPARLVAHEGGQRFAPGSDAWNTLKEWIADGMAYDREDAPQLLRIEVVPARRTVKPGSTFSLSVRAHYDNNTTNEVTGLALFDATDPIAAEVSDAGEVRAGRLPGEAAVVARYMGQVAVCSVTIPPTQEVPAEVFSKLPTANLIDKNAWPRLQALGLEPSAACDDATFLRRAALDIAGRAPTVAEARAFLADKTPDKRARWVDTLLRDPNTPEYWAGKWADLLRPNPDRAGVKSVYVIDQWLRASFRANKPLDQFAREILTAQGNTHKHGPTVVYRDKRDPEDLANVFTRLFLGVRLECARCHHHPNERWSQSDFYQTAAFFKDLKRKGKGVSPPISGDHETFWFAPGKSIEHPVTKAVMKPVPPGAEAVEIPEGTDPRLAFANWALAADNPMFARAMVNRVWAELFGRGFVEPVDDFRASNPAVHPKLLEALASDFASKGYDMHQLIRTIATSQLYQRSDAPRASNAADGRNFARSLRRRLPAEVLADLVADATGVPHKFEGMAPGSRAVHAWNVKIASDFLDAFGRPDASEDPPCERNRETSLVQTLHLMHAEDIQRRLANPKGRVAGLAGGETKPEAAIEELYLAALSRMPDAEEIKIALKAFDAEDATRQTALEDVLWSLFNSAEFLFNH